MINLPDRFAYLYVGKSVCYAEKLTLAEFVKFIYCGFYSTPPPAPPQVLMLALTFLVLFLGNFLTTLKVVRQKFQKNKGKLGKKE